MTSSSSALHLPLERVAGPRTNVVPIVFGAESFTGGVPNGWNPVGIGKVADFRKPFGLQPGNEPPTVASQMVVVCPNNSYSELNTEEFWGAWADFATTRALKLGVYILSTDRTGDGNVEETSSRFDGNNGNARGGIASVLFYAADMLQGDRGFQTWAGIVNRLSLECDVDDAHGLLSSLPVHTEQMFGQPGGFWARHTIEPPLKHLTIIRSQNGEPEGRVFRLLNEREHYAWKESGTLPADNL